MDYQAHIQWVVNTILLLVMLIATAWAQNNQLLRKAETDPNKRLLFENLPEGRKLRDSGLLNQNYRALIFSAFDDYLYVGGKEEFYKVDPNDLSVALNVTVSTTTTICGSGPECYNFVRLIQPLTATDLFVCGTDATRPKCYFADLTAGMGMMLTTADADFSAGNKVPFEPYQNFTWLYLDPNDDIFMATGAGSSRSRVDYVFASVNLTGPGMAFDSMIDVDRTPETLRSPDFVGEPIADGGRIFFFFRELAQEHINGGRIIFSRVGTVCKDDPGGVEFTQLHEDFTSYQKARLDCSIRADDLEFNYNELQDVYRDGSTIFAVFTTPRSNPASSAVCAYNLDEILDLFADNQFKGQASNGELWTVPTSVPGDVFQCGVPPAVGSYSFIREYPLKNRLVPNKLNYTAANDFLRKSDAPLLVMDDVRLSQILVERNVNGVDVMFLGTERGTIIKAYVNKDQSAAIVVEEIDIDENREDEFQAPIVTMLIRDGFIYAGTDLNVYKVPLQSCANKTKCECHCSQDPYCVLSGETCVDVTGSAIQQPGDTSKCLCSDDGTPSTGPIMVVRHHPCNDTKNQEEPCEVSVPQNEMAHLNFAAYAPEGTDLASSDVQCDCSTTWPESVVSNSVCNGRTFLTVSASISVTGDCSCSLTFSSGNATTKTLHTNIVSDPTVRITNEECLAEARTYDDEISRYKHKLKLIFRQWVAKNCADNMYVCDNCAN